MNSKTIIEAVARLNYDDSGLALIIPGDTYLAFDELDFSINTNAPDCVMLYKNRTVYACIDLRSVVGVRTLT